MTEISAVVPPTPRIQPRQPDVMPPPLQLPGPWVQNPPLPAANLEARGLQAQQPAQQPAAFADLLRRLFNMGGPKR
jgi:hypothetical protein